MLNLCNNVKDPADLFSKEKKIVLYGAGASAKLILASYYKRGLSGSLVFIVDQNEALDGTCCTINDIKVKVISLKHFCRDYASRMHEFALLFSLYYSLSIIGGLDTIPELDGVRAYIFSVILNRKTPAPFELRSLEIPRIPKIIHYFWIGGQKLPKEYAENIESWKKYCPGYEVIQWDESNYDFTKYRYAKEAVENKQYMYATDLVRKDVLFQYGGIYFDTDVELLRPIDDLLYNEAFIGIDDGGQVNSGSGLGAVKGSQIIGELLDIYRDMPFVNGDGSFNLSFNTYYETKYMIEREYLVRNEYQKIGDMVCFPREVFMPEGVVGLRDDYTEKTLANHKINPYDKTHCRKVLERVKDPGCAGFGSHLDGGLQ